MKKVFTYLDKNFEKLLIVPALSMMTLLIFAQVIFRYVIKAPLSWSEELARYLFIWMVYLAASLATRRGVLMKVDIIEVPLKHHPAALFALSMVSNLLSIIFCVVVTCHSAVLAYEIAFVYHRTSPALDLPMGLVYSAIPIGFGLMTIRFLQVTWFRIKEFIESRKNSASVQQ